MSGTLRVDDIVDPRSWPAAKAPRSMIGPVLSLGWLVALTTLVLVRHRPEPWAALLVADALVYGNGYLAALRYGPGRSARGRLVLTAVLLVLGVGFLVLEGRPIHVALLAYALVPAVLLLPLRWGRLLGVLGAVVAGVSTWLVNGSADWTAVAILFLLPLVLAALSQLNRALVQLDAARERIRELTLAQERERFAMDLHDLLGHSLTTITVKTGSTRRVLEATGDTERVAAELRDIEGLSREALSEIRSAVTGYRNTSLTAELARVHGALTAAGIKADVPTAVDDVRPELREPFAFVLREAVTNVIRHSEATRCEVRVGADWLEVRDNGRGAGSGAPGSSGGHGLSGMAARVEAAGGRLHAGALPGGGFLVKADCGRPG
jgi:two-component system sensor histidine kinase DesK